MISSGFPTWRGRPIPLTRKAIEDEIERLIDLLDVADGDLDLEDDDIEDIDEREPPFETILGGIGA